MNWPGIRPWVTEASPAVHRRLLGSSWSVQSFRHPTDPRTREREQRMSRAILEVRDVWVGDGPGAAVQGVSFSVGPGQVVGILGAAQAGKSRLLRCIGLDYPPTRGAVFLRGEEVSRAGS